MYITTDTYAIEKEIRSFCANHGLTIKYDDETTEADEDGKTLIVRKPDSRWTPEEWMNWKYSIYHTIGHHVGEMSDIHQTVVNNKISSKSFLGTMVNVLDDYRSEYFRYDEYEGRRQIMSEARAKWLETLIPQLKPESDKESKVLQTMLAYDTLSREEWQKDLSGKGEQMIKGFDDEQKAWLNKLKDGEWFEELKDPCSAEIEYNLAKKMIKQVFDMDDEEEEKKSQEAYTDAHGKGQGEGDEEGDIGEGKMNEGDKKREEEAWIKYKDFKMHNHDDEHGATYSPLHIEYDKDHSRERYNPATIDEFDVHDYTKTGHVGHAGRYYEMMKSLDTGRGLSGRVRRLLQVLSQSHYQHGMKKGKISIKNVYRCTLKDSGSYQEKIFKKKITSDILDTAVLVLTDMSGSMGGAKIVHAGKATVMLNEAIGKIGIPLEVVGFTETWHHIRHNIFKRFDGKINEDLMMKNFAKAAEDCMANNADGDSVLWSYNRLRTRKEKRKILIVLSDGSPAGYRGDGDSYLKDVVTQIEKEKKVEIYGIGIMDTNVERYYKNNKVIDSADSLESALLSVIKSNIINRN
jgi:hypothetical protein